VKKIVGESSRGGGGVRRTLSAAGAAAGAGAGAAAGAGGFAVVSGGSVGRDVLGGRVGPGFRLRGVGVWASRQTAARRPPRIIQPRIETPSG
jgi:hypothetical protein